MTTNVLATGIAAAVRIEPYHGLDRAGLENEHWNGDALEQQILASVNGYLIHRLNSPADAESITLVSGTAPGVTYTAQTAAGVSTGMASARLTREFEVHPDVLKRLKVGEAMTRPH